MCILYGIIGQCLTRYAYMLVANSMYRAESIIGKRTMVWLPAALDILEVLPITLGGPFQAGKPYVEWSLRR